MEKKTLTSIAIITFLMTSTAVVAMAEGEEGRPKTAASLAVQPDEAKEQVPHLSSTGTPPQNDGWSLLWPPSWFSSSTPSAPPPVEEKQGLNIPSAALVESAEKDSTPAPIKVALQDFHMGQLSPYTTSGFSSPEGTHRWTGKEATISFEGIPPRPFRVSFLNTKGLVTPSHSQKLIVKANGEEVSYDYTSANNNQTIEVSLLEAGPATIEFTIPTAISPSALGINSDKRELGISFREVKFQVPTPSVEAQQAGSTLPSAAPAPGGSSTPVGGNPLTEDDFVSQSQLLSRDQLQQLLQAAQSSDQDKAKELLSAPLSAPVSPVSPGTTPIPLTAEDEGWLRSLFRKILW